MNIKQAALRAACAVCESLPLIEQTAGETGQVEQDGRAEHAVWIDGVSLAIEPFIRRAVEYALNPCRRCSECANSEHHWMDNSDFGNDDDPEAEHPEASHCCKHCDAIGEQCQDCDGSGIDDEYGELLAPDCGNCDGHGVVEIVQEAVE